MAVDLGSEIYSLGLEFLNIAGYITQVVTGFACVITAGYLLAVVHSRWNDTTISDEKSGVAMFVTTMIYVFTSVMIIMVNIDTYPVWVCLALSALVTIWTILVIWAAITLVSLSLADCQLLSREHLSREHLSSRHDIFGYFTALVKSGVFSDRRDLESVKNERPEQSVTLNA